MRRTVAKLRNLADETYRGIEEEVYQAFADGGGGLVHKTEVAAADCNVYMTRHGLAAMFVVSGAGIEATCRALDLPTDWEGFRTLRLQVDNAGEAMTLEVTVVGARCRLIREVELSAGDGAGIDLDLRDLPLAAGIRPLFRPTSVRLTGKWEGPGSRVVCLRDLRLLPDDGTAPVEPVADRFGQRISTAWPTKIEDETELREHFESEAQELDAMEPPDNRNEYGGWTGGEGFEATGFFRIQKDEGGRWWLVDPAGRPFWSVGTTGVRTHDVTPVRGREALFAELPDESCPAWTADMKARNPGLSFYSWNVLRKYGDLDAWRDHVVKRFSRWGFNTFACWCEERFLQQRQIPHVRFTRSRSDGVPLVARRIPDVFDPAWESWLDDHLAGMTAPEKDNPWLIGYFVDNEGPWRSLPLLDAPRGSAVRNAWLDFARDRWGDLAAASRALGRTLHHWDDLVALRQEDIPVEGPGAEALADFRVLFADKYFSTIRRTLKRHDPDHMYLGCRFTRAPVAEGIAAAAGRHCDVLSVNCYSLYPLREEFELWHEMTGLPILIGEHHLPQKGPRQLPPLYESFTPAHRREGYVRFIRTFAEMPFSVGSHWFQHADQPITGRASNGENQVIGFVDVTDQPHAELVDAIRKVAANLYDWHAAAR